MLDIEEVYKQFRKDIAVRLPGRVLFSKVAGSQSYGLATETSDVDFVAVYQWPSRTALSMYPPAETVDGKGPDFQAHEIGKFCRLLDKSNPNIVECLFTENWIYSLPEWDDLLYMREQFINQTTLKQYLGYSRGQLARYKSGQSLHAVGGGHTEQALRKWLMHLMRLSFDALHIAHGEHPQVLQTGPDLDLLRNVRSGAVGPEEVIARFSDIEAEIDGLKPWSIPERADTKKLDDWLYGIRKLDWEVENLYKC